MSDFVQIHLSSFTTLGIVAIVALWPLPLFWLIVKNMRDTRDLQVKLIESEQAHYTAHLEAQSRVNGDLRAIGVKLDDLALLLHEKIMQK